MNEACQLLRGTVPEIVRRWEEAAVHTPWLNLPEGHRIDHLPDVVLSLVESALCAPRNPDAHRDQIYAAALHGQDRRVQGLSEADLLIEYTLLRRALWEQIRTLPLSEEQALQAVAQLDMALTIATLASFRGYHRPEIERLGRWPELLEQTVQESPFMRTL